jgi:hypothetical protein
MTTRSINELACGAADEVCRKLDGLSVDIAEDVGDGLKIKSTWKPHVEVTITTRESALTNQSKTRSVVGRYSERCLIHSPHTGPDLLKAGLA